MRTIGSDEASRRFSNLLDAVEAGATVTVTRGSRAIAEIRPARRHTGRDLRMALVEVPPPDDRFVADIAGAIANLTDARMFPPISRE